MNATEVKKHTPKQVKFSGQKIVGWISVYCVSELCLLSLCFCAGWPDPELLDNVISTKTL